MYKHKFSQTKYKSALTLIEMLIVIVIIWILSVALVPRIIWAQARARDSARQTHIRDINNALQIYYNDHTSYPTGALYLANTKQYITNTWTAWVNVLQNQLSPYISSLPSDPDASRAYVYGYVYNTPDHYYRLYADYEIKLSERLLWWYRNMETMSGSRYRDMSGNGNDGTVYWLLSTVAGKRWKWLSFNSNAERLVISPITGSVVSISLRYKRDETQSAANRRTLLWHQTANIHHLILHQSTKNIWIWDWWWKDFWYTVPNDSKYHHYAVVYRNWVDATLYVDGWNTYSSRIATTLNHITYPIWSIWNRTAGTYYAGLIDEVYIFNRALALSEIIDIYNQQ